MCWNSQNCLDMKRFLFAPSSPSNKGTENKNYEESIFLEMESDENEHQKNYDRYI
jgi:hypothetical protein